MTAPKISKLFVPCLAEGSNEEGLVYAFTKRSDETDIEYIRSDLIPHWVSVEDRLPEGDDLHVVVITRWGLKIVDFFGGYWGSPGVIYWLSGLPPIPKEE